MSLSPRPNSRFLKYLIRISYFFLGAMVIGVCFSPWIGKRIGVTPHLEISDAIVLLGAGVTRLPDGSMSPSLNSMQRLIYAIDLFRSGYAKRIVVSSGKTPPSNESEAHVIIDKMVSLGISRDSIIEESNSFDTESNAVEVIKLAQTLKLRKLLLVATSVQMRRAVWLFQRHLPTSLTLYPAPAPPIEIGNGFLAERLYVFGLLIHEGVAAALNIGIGEQSRKKINFALRGLFSSPIK